MIRVITNHYPTKTHAFTVRVTQTSTTCRKIFHSISILRVLTTPFQVKLCEKFKRDADRLSCMSAIAWGKTHWQVIRFVFWLNLLSFSRWFVGMVSNELRMFKSLEIDFSFPSNIFWGRNIKNTSSWYEGWTCSVLRHLWVAQTRLVTFRPFNVTIWIYLMMEINGFVEISGHPLLQWNSCP